MLSVAISNVPNDTFLFAPWMNQLIQAPEACFKELDLTDLHALAMENSCDIIKVSYGSLDKFEKNYERLPIGNTIVYNAAPVIVSKKNFSIEDIPRLSISIPGRDTTAHLLLKSYLPKFKEEIFVSAHESLKYVENNLSDCSLLIHCSQAQFTQKGIFPWISLMDLWQAKQKLPLPLGCIIANKRLGKHKIHLITKTLESSYRYAYAKKTMIMKLISEKYPNSNLLQLNNAITSWVNLETYRLSEEAKGALLQLEALKKQVRH